MDAVAARAEYRELRQKALGISEKAVAEKRGLSTAENFESRHTIEQAKAIRQVIEGERLTLDSDLMKQL